MSDKKDLPGSMVAAALLLAVGIAVAGYFVGNTLYKARIAANTASVKGLAERDVRANVAVWSINFSSSNANLEEVYRSAQQDQEKVITFLKTSGFADTEITKGALTVNKEEQRNPDTGAITGVTYNINGAVALRSEDVDKVSTTVQRIGELVGQGVLINNSNPSYIFTKLNDIKPEMLGEATRNARIAAEQFAKDANAKVGKIQNAEQGTFSFSPRDSSSEYESDTASINKTVRVVTTITFYLED